MRIPRGVLVVGAVVLGPLLVAALVLVLLHLQARAHLQRELAMMAASGLPMDPQALQPAGVPRDRTLLELLNVIPWRSVAATGHKRLIADLIAHLQDQGADYHPDQADLEVLQRVRPVMEPCLHCLREGGQGLASAQGDGTRQVRWCFSTVKIAQLMTIASGLGDRSMLVRLDHLVDAFAPSIRYWAVETARTDARLRDMAYLIAAIRGEVTTLALAAWSQEPCRSIAWYHGAVAQYRLDILLPAARTLLGEASQSEEPWEPPRWNLLTWTAGPDAMADLLAYASGLESGRRIPPPVPRGLPQALLDPEEQDFSVAELLGLPAGRGRPPQLLGVAIENLERMDARLHSSVLHDAALRAAALVVARWRSGVPLPRDQAQAERCFAGVACLAAAPQVRLRYHLLADGRFDVSDYEGPCVPAQPASMLGNWIPGGEHDPRIVITEHGCFVDCRSIPRIPLAHPEKAPAEQAR